MKNKKPNLVKRAGNRFVVDESVILPYMRKNRDVILSAVTIACQDFKLSPKEYENLKPVEKLQKINESVYELLESWGIYKG
jgi:hypothetical protein